MDYEKRFTIEKSKWYEIAMRTYPFAMKREFQIAAMELECEDGNRVLNIPGACVPINQYVAGIIEHLPFEINPKFASVVGLPVCSLKAIPIESGSIDRVLSLAALHHSSKEERLEFLHECKRVLKPGGKLVIGDVKAGSKQASWLNEFVNTWNSAGHTGTFWTDEDCELFREVDLPVSMKVHTYTWDFSSYIGMIDFCKYLFGLDLASSQQIAEGLMSYLQPYQDQTGWHLPWELVYFVSTLPPSESQYPPENTESLPQD